MRDYLKALVQSSYSVPAMKTAAIVGTVLFLINHGVAIWNSQMTLGRWVSGAFTYVVPYAVHVFGQFTARRGQ